MKIKSILITSLLAGLTLTSQLAQAHPPGHMHPGAAHPHPVRHPYPVHRYPASHWHGGVGVYFGSPYPFHAYPYAAYPYGYPYAYTPPPVIIAQPPEPQVYIEQGSGTTEPAQTTPPAASADDNAQNYWYFCEQSNAYYPYVKDCPAGWKQVTPSPPATSE